MCQRVLLRSEDGLWGLVLHFGHVGFWDGLKGVRLSCEHLCLLSHFNLLFVTAAV